MNRNLLPHYEKGSLATPDGAAVLPYVIVGTGPISQVIIPGAGDGLSLVTDAALNLAWFYRRRSDRYRLLIVSRRQPIPEGFGSRQFAEDFLALTGQLNWPACIWECNSAGGPVGQWVAVLQPERVSGLILSCSLHRTSPQTRAVVSAWLEMIQAGRWADFTWDTIQKTFRPETVRKYRPFKWMVRWISRPDKYPGRIQRLLQPLLDLDQSSLPPQIQAPTLVIGGQQDQVVPAEVQREMAGLIPNARLKLYPGYGHGNDQENPAYQVEVDRFAAQVRSHDPLEPG